MPRTPGTARTPAKEEYAKQEDHAAQQREREKGEILAQIEACLSAKEKQARKLLLIDEMELIRAINDDTKRLNEEERRFCKSAWRTLSKKTRLANTHPSTSVKTLRGYLVPRHISKCLRPMSSA